MPSTSKRSTAESSPPAGRLLWKQRAVVVTGPTHRRRIWLSRCGWYRVVHSRCLYGPRKGKQAIPDVFYAMKFVVTSGRSCWEVISQHRRRERAVLACEKDARKDRDESQVCDLCGKRPPAHFGVRTLLVSKAQLCGPCWKHLNRPPRSPRSSTRRPKSGGSRKCLASPNQLSLSFGPHGTLDTVSERPVQTDLESE
jgi:hypothetical protein